MQAEGPGDPRAFVASPQDEDSWSAQVFRSIDSASAAGLPEGDAAAGLWGLSSGANLPKACLGRTLYPDPC